MMAANDKQINKQPVGYGMLTAVLDCNLNFLICCKYEGLHVQVLLHFQDELMELEEELENLDQKNYKENKQWLIFWRFDDETSEKCNKLFYKINIKLIEYDIYLKCVTNLHVSHFYRWCYLPILKAECNKAAHWEKSDKYF